MRFCGACGAPLGEGEKQPRAVDDPDQAQRRHVTVMYCDLVESTVLAEALDPEDFRELLRRYQDVGAQAVERFNGYVAQYIGDGILAFFGYPRAHEDDTQRAIHAGLAITEEVKRINPSLQEQFGVELQVRIGLHTGFVVAGEVGGGNVRDERAVVGETPHIAARLQEVAPPGSVVVSDETHDMVERQFEMTPLGTPTLKGISRPIGVHRVLGPLRCGTRFDTSGARPMTDRVAEIARLREAWQLTTGGHGVIVHISGEAGIGKSRLVRALREDVTGQASAQHVLQCSPHHSTTALHPVIQFLDQLIGLDRMDTFERGLEAIRRAVDHAPLDPTEAVPLLADVLSIPGAGEGPALTPREARDTTLRIVETLVLGRSTSRPLLLVVEDVHWADPSTLELLERVVASVPAVPVGCVLTFRGDFDPPWSARHTVVEVELGPLTDDYVRAMASAAGVNAMDDATLAWVEQAADGIPLFVEEMVKSVAAKQPAAQPDRGEDARIPPTLQGLMAERLDRLPELDDVIDLAAVLGHHFERGLLEALTPLKPAALEAALERLAAEDVLRPVDGSRSRLAFKHVLLQEAAYERILRRRRRVLHARVAELLAAQEPLARGAEPEVIAHHFSRADRPDQAVPYWRLAGSRALRRAAFEEAAEHFRRALDSLERAEATGAGVERADLLVHRGAALQAGRGYAANGVEAAYTAARAALRPDRDRERLVPVIRGQWMFHLARAEYDSAMALADEMLAMGGGGEHPVCMAEGHLYLGLTHMYTGGLDRARKHLEASHAGYVEPEEPDDVYLGQGDTGVGALAYLSVVLWNQGHVREADERSMESVALAERVRGPVAQAQAWGMHCGLLMAQRDLSQLGGWVERTRAHSVSHNIGYWSAVCSVWSAWLRARAGEPAGTARLQEQIDAYERTGARLARPHFQLLLADLFMVGGDRAAALAALAAGQEHIDLHGEHLHEPELQVYLGRVLMTGDEPDAAAASAAYQRALEGARKQNARLIELRAATHLAAHQLQTGAPCTALQLVDGLYVTFPADAQAPDLVRARALLDTAATVR